MRLLFHSNADSKSAWAARLAALDPTIELRLSPDFGDPAEIDAALVWKPPPGLLARLPNLKAILSLGMGVDHIFADPQLPQGVPVARLVDRDLINRMSEYCALAVLRYHRNADAYDAFQRERRWKPLPEEPAAKDRRVGILGVGEIGRDLAAKLGAFGFDLAGWSRTPKALPGVACFHGADGLRPFLARSEILVCLLPLTRETEGILGAAAFAALPKGAVVVNAARGGHVVDADLLAALDSGNLRAAQLDVFRQEPLPSEHPFWSHPKIRVTPHNAGITDPMAAAGQIVENLHRLRRGEPLLNVVDRERGY
ncbi:MAG: glyoxylate/hydroxypyruvate reductase A [Rhodospirillaceae bacterium]|nr:glyoxylate/hydroxypyruvate reductase A [Rhodospirillaceae bacterium]